MDLRRILILVIGCISTFVGGSLYLFGVYADQIKKEMHMSQEQINDIGAGMFVGGCVPLLLVNPSVFEVNYSRLVFWLTSLAPESL